MPRKNDSIILEKLSTIAVDIAIIKTKSEETENHLKTLNGKVQAHESRLQVTEGTVAINSRIIAGLGEATKAANNFWERNWEKLFWTLIGLGMVYIATKF